MVASDRSQFFSSRVVFSSFSADHIWSLAVSNFFCPCFHLLILCTPSWCHIIYVIPLHSDMVHIPLSSLLLQPSLWLCCTPIITPRKSGVFRAWCEMVDVQNYFVYRFNSWLATWNHIMQWFTWHDPKSDGIPKLEMSDVGIHPSPKSQVYSISQYLWGVFLFFESAVSLVGSAAKRATIVICKYARSFGIGFGTQFSGGMITWTFGIEQIRD